jgi:hypothetical protein
MKPTASFTTYAYKSCARFFTGLAHGVYWSHTDPNQ